MHVLGVEVKSPTCSRKNSWSNGRKFPASKPQKDRTEQTISIVALTCLNLGSIIHMYIHIHIYTLWIHGHCLRRYLTLQIIVKLYPSPTSFQKVLGSIGIYKPLVQRVCLKVPLDRRGKPKNQGESHSDNDPKKMVLFSQGYGWIGVSQLKSDHWNGSSYSVSPLNWLSIILIYTISIYIYHIIYIYITLVPLEWPNPSGVKRDGLVSISTLFMEVSFAGFAIARFDQRLPILGNTWLFSMCI